MRLGDIVSIVFLFMFSAMALLGVLRLAYLYSRPYPTFYGRKNAWFWIFFGALGVMAHAILIAIYQVMS